MTNFRPIETIIIDDEENARNSLSKLLSIHCPQVKIIGQAAGVQEGVALIQNAAPKLVFLDIEMQDGSGFDLLKLLPEIRFNLIFVTAYDKFAVRAFQVSAIDYLLKPVEADLLLNAVAKVNTGSEHNHLNKQISLLLSNQQQISKIALPFSDGLIFQPIADILYLEADDNYTHFYINDGKNILVSKTMKEFENTLPESLFCRTHKSFIVNIQHVERFVTKDGTHLILSNGVRVPVSKRKKETIMERFK